MRSRSAILLTLGLSISVATVCEGRQKSPLTFEVASIRQNNSGDRNTAVIPRPGRLTATNVTVMQLMRNAFQIQEFQVSRQPAWFNSEKYDLEATAGADGRAEIPGEWWREMLQTLLADRFKLAFHREERTMTVYELSVVKSGHKMTAVSLEDCAPPPRGLCGAFRASSSQIIGDQVSMDAFLPPGFQVIGPNRHQQDRIARFS
jgi:uncharacterized protein (TIGR03435 family)